MSIEEDIKAKSFPSEEEKTYVNLVFTASHFESKFNQFIKTFELTTEQYKVLRILRGQYPNPILSGGIQAYMLRTRSNSTRLVDKLVDKKLVSRSYNLKDKRKIMVVITKEGLDLLNVLDSEVASFLKTLINSNVSQLTQLNNLLDELRTQSP